MAYDLLHETLPTRADREYLEILHLAAQESEAAVEQALRLLIDGDQPLSHAAIAALVRAGQKAPALTAVRIDQRIIDELVGHQTEAMRRRYRHLYPQTVADAVKQVFG